MKNLYTRLRHAAVLALTVATLASAAHAASSPAVTLLTPITTGLSTPVRMATDPAGFIYVADPRAGGVVKLAPNGALATDSSGKPVVIKTSRPPLGVAVKANGDLLVSQGTTVQMFSMVKPSAGTPSTPAFSYPAQPTATLQPTGGFQLANGIAIASDGTVFVTDSLANRVHRFSGSTSAALGSFGGTGTGFGQFDTPTAIAYEAVSNQVAVVDTVNGRIQFFTSTGQFVRAIGTRGSDPNGSDTDRTAVYFNAPQGIAFEYTRTTPARLYRIYVVDSFQSRVQVIDPASEDRLRYIGQYGPPDRTGGAFRLIHPADVLFDTVGNRILVANGFGNLMSFGIDGGTNPDTTSTQPMVTYNIPASITPSGSFTVTGTVDRPALVTIDTQQNSPAPVCTATFTDTTHWSCTVTMAQQNTATPFWVKAQPLIANGQLFTSDFFSVSWIQNAPSLSVNPFLSPTARDTVTLTGTSTLSTRTVICPVASGSCTGAETPAANPLNWSFPLTLPASSNTFRITATANGQSTIQDVVIERIIITPTMLPSGSTVPTPVQTVSGSVNGVSEVLLSLNGATQPTVLPVLDGAFRSAVTLKAGTNTLVLSARDASGATLTTPPTLAYTFDATAPAVAITSINGGAVAEGASIPRGNLTLAGTASTSSNLNLSIDGGAPQAVTNSSGSWSQTIDTTGLAPGQHTFLISATGNAKTSNALVTLTLVDPLVTPQLTLAVTDRLPVGQAGVTYLADATTSLDTVHVSGTASTTDPTKPVVAVDATYNGSAMPVAFNSSVNPDSTTGLPAWGYMISTPVNFTTPGRQTFVVTAHTADNTSSAITRTLFFSQTAPQLVGAVTPSSGSNFTVTVGSGVTRVCIADCSGTNDITGSGTLDPATGNITYTVAASDLATLTFFDDAGNSSRNGRILGGSGEPTVADALHALRMSVHSIPTTRDALLRADVAPFTNKRLLASGMYIYDANPDGKIDIEDVMAIFYRAVGIATW